MATAGTSAVIPAYSLIRMQNYVLCVGSLFKSFVFVWLGDDSNLALGLLKSQTRILRMCLPLSITQSISQLRMPNTPFTRYSPLQPSRSKNNNLLCALVPFSAFFPSEPRISLIWSARPCVLLTVRLLFIVSIAQHWGVVLRLRSLVFSFTAMPALVLFISCG